MCRAADSLCGGAGTAGSAAASPNEDEEMQTAADPDELETGSDSAGYTSDSDTSCSDGEGVRERGCGSPAADELCDSSDDNGFSDEEQPADEEQPLPL